MSVRRSLRRVAAITLVSVAAVTGLVACSSSSNDEDVVRLGTTDPNFKSWKVLEKKAKENGIEIELESFSDYNTPNRALSEGQIDANLFQHLKFLAEHNNGTGDNLVPVGSTQVIPLALFWKDHDSLDGIDGQEVAIPKDATNQGRAITVLAQAKLLTLKSDNIITPTPADIDEEASKVKVKPVDATQTTVAYNEGTPAIINNSFLGRAGIDPKTAVFQDDPASPDAEPYINVFVTTQEKQNDEKIAKLVELWHDPEVVAANNEDSNGTAVEINRQKAELEQILKRLEDELKK